MKVNKNILIVLGAVLLLSVLISGFVLMQPSSKDILVETINTMETIEDAHAVVEISVDSPEKSGNATVEIWGVHGEDGPGAFRLEVIKTSEDKAAGAVLVSDGETLWAYSPSENKVLVGTLEEAKEMMAEQEFEGREFDRGDFDKSDFEHPENAEEAVGKLLEYVDADKLGSQDLAGVSAYYLKLIPIPEQMPVEFAAVGGLINLWIDKDRYLPLAVEYSGGSLGEFKATALELEVNTGIDEALFSFEVPEGAEVMGFEDLKPQSISLEDASGAAGFDVLTPAEVPPGATLVEILEVRGAIVQRYALPDGGSFTIAQGASDQAPKPAAESQDVEVRSLSGTLFASEEGDQVLLTWVEDDLYFYIAGDLSADQALSIAESLE